MRGTGSAESVGFWWKEQRESCSLHTEQEGIVPQVWLVGTHSFLITGKCFHIIGFCMYVYTIHIKYPGKARVSEGVTQE